MITGVFYLFGAVLLTIWAGFGYYDGILVAIDDYNNVLGGIGAAAGSFALPAIWNTVKLALAYALFVYGKSEIEDAQSDPMDTSKPSFKDIGK